MKISCEKECNKKCHTQGALGIIATITTTTTTTITTAAAASSSPAPTSISATLLANN